MQENTGPDVARLLIDPAQREARREIEAQAQDRIGRSHGAKELEHMHPRKQEHGQRIGSRETSARQRRKQHAAEQALLCQRREHDGAERHGQRVTAEQGVDGLLIVVLRHDIQYRIGRRQHKVRAIAHAKADQHAQEHFPLEFPK